MVLTRPFGLPIGDGVAARASTDVFLEGHAYPAGVGECSSKVAFRCAELSRQLVVSGPRLAQIRDGRVTFSDAKAFERVALTHQNAYGGGLGGDRAYPRNPAGKGFVTRDRIADKDIELPLVEEGTRLTAMNLIAEWAEWWRQPPPAIVEPLLPTNMPRLFHLGIDGLYPLPGKSAERSLAELLQEAPPHSRLSSLPEGAPIEVNGCLPNSAPFRARAPRAPRYKVTVDGRQVDAEARAQVVRLRPEAGELSITYAIEHGLARTFLPGIHARIPIAVDVEGTHIAFPTEEPLLAQLRRAKAKLETSEQS